MHPEAVTPNFKGKRTLAAVVFTDAVSFSLRMSADESGTFNSIHRDFLMMNRLCHQYEGQVLKTIGDSLLMCFTSAVNAVNCAIEIQKTLAQTATQLPPEEVLSHRIGIHLGDVYFNGSDVIGNGVNIASRLQEEASPGGICISQTLYEVVKWNLDLPVSYLGERQLKNFCDALPIYLILPTGSADLPPSLAPMTSPAPPLLPEQRSLQAAGDTYPGPPDLPQSLYREIAQNLSHTEHRLRVKKLLLYACRNIWEPDPIKLGQLQLQELLPQLLYAAPTLIHLQTLLYDIVGGLNKQAEYFPIASWILYQVEPLYPQPALLERNPYTEIAAELERSEWVGRIKKLLLWMGRGTWETDIAHLNQVKLSDLLSELVESAPTLAHLCSALENAASSLNKPAEYEQVANLIQRHLEPLYVSAAELTCHPWSQSLPDVVSGAEKPSAIPLAPPPRPQLPPPPSWGTHRFDLRLEVMKHTNPLRAKILLVAVLYPPLSANDPYGAAIAQHKLEDLLQTLLGNCGTTTEIESILSKAAVTLEPRDEYTQVAGAIAHSMRLYYP
ncbi:adenylate/guanylate cyclase domain-containing protein [Neosynechococcus sphagnicola]|uniref:adenylate/guanylate cyclase domain-containing protein n=1 Tax=Neosynechococcus sphagnicola TaxID=1501145 RepID=UPI00069235D9|nr:adenylate/guanylate cyclase domain-containing protein [Neosynechococcus sphagnicola]